MSSDIENDQLANVKTETFNQAKQQQTNKGFWIRPIDELEERLIYNEEIRKTNLRTISHAYHRNITKVILADIEEAYKHNQNWVCASIMKAGYGKTLLMLSLADKCSKILEKVKEIDKAEIFTSIGKHDSAQVIKKLKENSIFFEDEDPFISGTDSVTTEHALINVQEVAFRFTSITYLTAAVTKKRLPKNYFACILEPIMRNDHERKTLCRVLSGSTLLPLGHIVVNLLDETDPLLTKHSLKEKDYKERMLEKGGMESIAIDPKELEIKAKRLLKYLTGHEELILSKFTDKEKRVLRKISIERVKTAMAKLAYELSGSSHQQKRIIDECWNSILQFKIEIDVEKEIKDEKDRKAEEKARELQKQMEEQKSIFEKLKFKQDQEQQIQVIIPEILNEFSPLPSKLLLRHEINKRGIDKDYLNYAMGELELAIYQKEKSIESKTEEKIRLFKVDEKNRFIFDLEQYLEIVKTSKEKINSRLKVSWETLVNLYLDKKEGMTRQELTEKYNISGGSVTNYVNLMKGKISEEIGFQYEKFRSEMLSIREDRLYDPKDWRVKPGRTNSNDPDITVKHKNENKIYYYSLKIRNLNETKSSEVLELSKKFAPEIKAYQESIKNGIESKVFIDFYNLYNHTHSIQEIDFSEIGQFLKETYVLLKWTGEIEIKIRDNY